jgi:hypothetical protein
LSPHRHCVSLAQQQQQLPEHRVHELQVPIAVRIDRMHAQTADPTLGCQSITTVMSHVMSRTNIAEYLLSTCS